MADGTSKPIGQVREGDRVLAHDPVSGCDEPARVERTFTHERVPTLRVATTAGVVETTGTHPFYVAGRGYVRAEWLREGDRLHGPGGRVVEVVSVQATGRVETVFNLAVAADHNYHVVTGGGQPILVHNNRKGCGPESDDDYDPAELVERVAREQASQGRSKLLSTLSEPVQQAADRQPWLSNAFTGHAVHNQTAQKLRELHPGDFSYNASNGPDFYHKPTGRYIELTTPGSVAAHERRAAADPRYDKENCTIVTYGPPSFGT